MKLSLRQKLKINPASSGQTMIETLVAVFMLTMGVSSALGLAIFAFGSSANIAKQIIATGLAREGLEAVKNTRDTNWLQQTNIDSNCYDYSANPPQNDAKCYSNWLGNGGNSSPYYCLDPKKNNGNNCNGNGSSQAYFRLAFDSSKSGTDGDNYKSGYWQIQPGTNNWGLDYDSAGANGFYTVLDIKNGPGSDASSSGYFRRISIQQIYTGPYDPAVYGGGNNPGALLQVDAQVWWTDKKCPAAPTYETANPACRLDLQEDLTNWKTY